MAPASRNVLPHSACSWVSVLGCRLSSTNQTPPRGWARVKIGVAGVALEGGAPASGGAGWSECGDHPVGGLGGFDDRGLGVAFGDELSSDTGLGGHDRLPTKWAAAVRAVSGRSALAFVESDDRRGDEDGRLRERTSRRCWAGTVRGQPASSLSRLPAACLRCRRSEFGTDSGAFFGAPHGDRVGGGEIDRGAGSRWRGRRRRVRRVWRGPGRRVRRRGGGRVRRRRVGGGPLEVVGHDAFRSAARRSMSVRQNR